MLKQTRLLVLLLLPLLASKIAAQSLQPVPSMVQIARDKGSSFASIQLFNKVRPLDASAARFAQQAQFLQTDIAQLQQLVSDKPKTIRLSLPYNDELIVVDLVQADIMAPGFTLNKDLQPQSYFSGLHYRGMVHGNPHSIAAFSFFENEVMGLISDEAHNNLVLGKVQTKGNTAGYMLYSDLELAMDNPFECTASETEDKPAKQPLKAGEKSGAPRPLKVNLQATNGVLQARGGNVSSAADYLCGLFNQVAVLFANEGIQMMLSHIDVWETTDPYSATNTRDALEQLRTDYSQTDADILHLVGLGNNAPESRAMNTLCSTAKAAAYSGIQVSFSNVPTYAWATEVLAHEIGHTLGARHTQWCGWPGGAIDHCPLPESGCPAGKFSDQNSGTVMSYCPMSSPVINFCRGFGPAPGTTMRDYIAQAPCLVRTTAPLKPAVQRTSTPAPAEVATVFNLAPNPATKQVSIQLNLDKETTVQITLLDLTGRPVLKQTATLKSGNIPFDLSGLPKGIYLVQVSDQERPIMTKRLIKE